MKIKLQKLTLSFVFFLAMGIVQSCQEKNDVKPQSSQSADPSVLEEIKNLGFDAASIQDKGNYYLAEGDIYFAKNKTATRTVPERGKSKVKIERGQRPAMTVGIDQAVAANAAWKNGVDHAIATWNANQNHHFTFKMVEHSDEADIFIQDDRGELSEDVEVASEFAAHGRVGSTMRVNLDYATSTADQIKTKALEGLSHSVGLRHADLLKNDALKNKVSARIQSDPEDYLYLISGDFLWAEDRKGLGASLLSTSWAGSTCIASTGGILYVIQFDWLYAALPDGSWWGLTGGWTGTKVLTDGWDQKAFQGSVFALQGDWIWKINPDDGGWLSVTDNGGTRTPWSNAKFMCEMRYGDKIGLKVIENVNIIGRTFSLHSFVCTDPTDPTFGKRINFAAPNTFLSIVVGGIAPALNPRHASKDDPIYYINVNNTSFAWGISMLQDGWTGSPGENSHAYPAGLTINWNKTQSVVSDYLNLYLLVDGGIYCTEYYLNFKAIRWPGVWSSTAILTMLH